ncbi:hypothetical protein, partial [Desulfuromonas thiophila]|uniref:hypothetical protein n=1 Tax=Desulfuromonas thiophila TaxID=57664 RepID=UPI0024A8B210
HSSGLPSAAAEFKRYALKERRFIPSFSSFSIPQPGRRRVFCVPISPNRHMNFSIYSYLLS